MNIAASRKTILSHFNNDKEILIPLKNTILIDTERLNFETKRAQKFITKTIEISLLIFTFYLFTFLIKDFINNGRVDYGRFDVFVLGILLFLSPFYIYNKMNFKGYIKLTDEYFEIKKGSKINSFKYSETQNIAYIYNENFDDSFLEIELKDGSTFQDRWFYNAGQSTSWVIGNSIIDEVKTRLI